MPRPKSLLPRIVVDEVCRAHNCQHNPTHRLHKGDKRLSVTVKKTKENYCVRCGLEIINNDIKKLNSLAEELKS
jgi:hypothetical protein